jgi:hypothetical protein
LPYLIATEQARPSTMASRWRLKLMFVVLIVAVIGGVAAARSVPLSEVEVRLVQTPHRGCFGPCVNKWDRGHPYAWRRTPNVRPRVDNGAY